MVSLQSTLIDNLLQQLQSNYSANIANLQVQPLTTSPGISSESGKVVVKPFTFGAGY
jgi:hypothetical protein